MKRYYIVVLCFDKGCVDVIPVDLNLDDNEEPDPQIFQTVLEMRGYKESQIQYMILKNGLNIRML